jgi:hypothetical protein
MKQKYFNMITCTNSYLTSIFYSILIFTVLKYAKGISKGVFILYFEQETYKLML